MTGIWITKYNHLTLQSMGIQSGRKEVEGCERGEEDYFLLPHHHFCQIKVCQFQCQMDKKSTFLQSEAKGAKARACGTGVLSQAMQGCCRVKGEGCYCTKGSQDSRCQDKDIKTSKGKRYKGKYRLSPDMISQKRVDVSDVGGTDMFPVHVSQRNKRKTLKKIPFKFATTCYQCPHEYVHKCV